MSNFPVVARWIAIVVLCCAAAVDASAMTTVPYGNVMPSHSGKCLSVEGASTVTNARILQAACTSADSLQWQVQPNGAYYQLIDKKSGQCLDVTGASKSQGAQVVQNTCANSDSQAITVTAQGAGFQLRFKQSGYCADTSGASQADGATIIQWTCNGQANQTWVFQQKLFVQQVPLDIMGTQNGQCVAVSGASTAAGAAVVQNPCSGTGADTWSLKPVGATVAIVDKASGLCLDISGASTTAGAAAIQWTCSYNNNQLWTLKAYNNAWRLVSVNSGLCLRVTGTATAAATALIQSTCAGDGNELWTFHTPTIVAKWSGVVATTVDPVAAANLPSGKLVAWSADQQLAFNSGTTGQTYTEVLDPVAGSQSMFLVTNTGHDMFCPGTAVLDDGRVLVNGGIDSTRTSLFDPVSGNWSVGGTMNIGRGYNASVMVPDGNVFTLGGSWSGNGQGNRTGELWNKATSTWSVLSGVPADPIQTADQGGLFRADNHAWLQMLSGSRLLHVGPSKTMHWINAEASGGGTIASAGLRGDDSDSMNGNAAQFDVDQIIKVGGAPNYSNSDATTSAQLVNAAAATPVVTRIAPMTYARAFANAVVLPGGQVVVVGGQTYALPFSDDNSVLVPEQWDPGSRVFERMQAMATPRNYHGVALLLPDGRVWVGGGGLCGSCATNHANYEILTPPYLLNADGSAATRPAITAVTQTAPKAGTALDVKTSTPVTSFALMRLSSVTHTVNNDQRRIPLAATTTDGAQYHMVLPSDPGTLLPGYYMLFALDARGVPSMAQTLRITAS